MKKYYLIGKGIIDEILMDRINFVIWRFRIVISVLIAYFLWSAVLAKQPIVGNYTHSLLLTYILFASLVGSLIFSTRSFNIGDEINQGNLSNHLLRPYNYFFVLLSSDIADKLMNVLFSICELFILYVIFKPAIFWQLNSIYLFSTILAIIIGMLLFFLFSILLGAVGFWSAEVWGPRFIFGVSVAVFSGQMFPLDMLPKQLLVITQFSPFTYLIYFPVKVYLGQITISQIIFGIVIGFSWIIILYFLAKYIWANGLKHYTAQGR